MNAKEIRSKLEDCLYVSGSYDSLLEYTHDIESMLHEALKTLDKIPEDSIQVKRFSDNDTYTNVILSSTELENSLLCVQYVEKKLDLSGIESIDLFALSKIFEAYLSVTKQKAVIKAAGNSQ